jgi:hypothetical protein
MCVRQRESSKACNIRVTVEVNIKVKVFWDKYHSFGGKCFLHSRGRIMRIERRIVTIRGLVSSVGTVTGYGLDVPGIEFRWRRVFPHMSRPVLGPTQLPVQWYLVFPGGKERPGRDADPSLPSSTVAKKV